MQDEHASHVRRYLGRLRAWRDALVSQSRALGLVEQEEMNTTAPTATTLIAVTVVVLTHPLLMAAPSYHGSRDLRSL